jgi:hypothetical protein
LRTNHSATRDGLRTPAIVQPWLNYESWSEWQDDVGVDRQ